MKVKHLQYGRIIGTGGLVLAQIVLLFYSIKIGLVLATICNFLSIPYFVRYKYWDLVLLSVVASVINFGGIIHHWNT